MRMHSTRAWGEGARVVAGVDEAGLGPLLGPLTVGFTAFRLDEGHPCLWRRLNRVVSGDPTKDRRRLVVNDSKLVFTRNERGRKRLEHAVLAFLARSGARPCTGRALLDVAPEPLRPPQAVLDAHPWYAHLPATLPLWADGGMVEIGEAKLARHMQREGVEPAEAGVRLVTVSELNRALASTDNKAAAHWGWVSGVIRHLWDRFALEGLRVVTDRQGGRFHYGALLSELFTGCEVRVRRERPACSDYLVLEPGTERRMHLTFAEGAEQLAFPVALASCLAKYTREVCMEAFNAYFSALQPGLRPTAGYTTDGRRWMRDAAPALSASGLASELVLRAR